MKSIIKSSLIVLLLSLAPFSVSAQGNLFDKGESGSSLIFGYTETDNATVTQGSFVVTTKGVFDFGITLGSIDPDFIDRDFRIFGVHIELLPIRESIRPGGMPINISLLGIWTSNQPSNNSSYGLGASLFKKLSLNELVYFVPTFGVTRVWLSGVDFDAVNVTTFAFPLVMKITPKLRVSFTGSYASSDEESGTGLFIGLTFMSKTKIER